MGIETPEAASLLDKIFLRFQSGISAVREFDEAAHKMATPTKNPPSPKRTAPPSALKPESLRVLSAHSQVIACQIEEHAMVSTACWLGGVGQWLVAHDAEDGLTNLDVMGNPPTMFEETRSTKLQLQGCNDGVDHLFDVPLTLAESLVGF